MLKDQGRLEEAEAAYREAIRLDPSYAYPWYNLGFLLTFHLEQYPKGEQAFRQALALTPETSFPAFLLAWNLVRQGRWDEARTWLAQAWARGDEAFFEWIWPVVLDLFRDLLARGWGKEAVALLDQTGMGERWLPLRAAVHALAEGNPGLLDALAPEVRIPARELLSQLEP